MNLEKISRQLFLDLIHDIHPELYQEALYSKHKVEIGTHQKKGDIHSNSIVFIFGKKNEIIVVLLEFEIFAFIYSKLNK